MYQICQFLLRVAMLGYIRRAAMCPPTSTVASPTVTTTATPATTTALTTTIVTVAPTTTTAVVVTVAPSTTTVAPVTTTTPAPTTTTTTATTTTTTISPCLTCTLDTITLTPGDNMGTASPQPLLRTDAMNCLLLTVTCTAPAGQQTFMQFNVNQGGPVQPIGAVVTADLNCVNGQWVYMPGMGLPSRVITEVNCVNTVGP